ncbi:hypothetical protein BC835DRAFT_1310812 [Cytidiella melzeri]|nr:hypothetical protein BC835DRAFT_1310812 [Cytidiella melzeri]
MTRYYKLLTSIWTRLSFADFDIRVILFVIVTVLKIVGIKDVEEIVTLNDCYLLQREFLKISSICYKHNSTCNLCQPLAQLCEAIIQCFELGRRASEQYFLRMLLTGKLNQNLEVSGGGLDLQPEDAGLVLDGELMEVECYRFLRIRSRWCRLVVKGKLFVVKVWESSTKRVVVRTVLLCVQMGTTLFAQFLLSLKEGLGYVTMDVYVFRHYNHDMRRKIKDSVARRPGERTEILPNVRNTTKLYEEQGSDDGGGGTTS